MRPFTMLLALTVVLLGREALGQELKLCATFRPHTDGVDCVALSPEGSKLATGGWTLRTGTGEVTLWDVSSRKAIVTYTLKHERPQILRFSPDGKLLASLNSSGLTIWDVAARKRVVTLTSYAGNDSLLAFSLDGKKLGLASRNEAWLWDLTSGKKLSSFRRPVSAQSSRAMAFSKDLRILASANHQEIDLWDVESGKRLTILSEHRGLVSQVAYSSDGKTLVVASRLDQGRLKFVGDVRLWNVATGKERAVFQEGIASISSVSLSPDGKTLALLNWREFYPDEDSDLRILDVATGKRRVLPFSPSDPFALLGFATDGRLFVIDSPHRTTIKTIKLWEVSLGKSADK